MNIRKVKTPNLGQKFENWEFIRETKWPYCLFKCKCGKEKKYQFIM